MRRLLIGIALAAVTLLLLVFFAPRTVKVYVECSGPDVEYELMLEGMKIATIRCGEWREIAGEGALELAVEGIVLDSVEVKRGIKVLFRPPSLQSPLVEYSYYSKGVNIEVRDEGPYPVIWKIESKTVPTQIEFPFECVQLVGELDGDVVYKRKLCLAGISSLHVTYDGSTLRIEPKIRGFFMPTHLEIMGIPFKDFLELPASSLPKSIEISEFFGSLSKKVEYRLPNVPDPFEGDRVKVVKGLTLNGREVEEEITLPEGINTLVWRWKNGGLVFERVWKVVIDRTPPEMNVSFKSIGGRLLVQIKLNEFVTVKIKMGDVELMDSGEEVSFMIRRPMGDHLEIEASDRFGNVTKRVLEIPRGGEGK